MTKIAALDADSEKVLAKIKVLRKFQIESWQPI